MVSIGPPPAGIATEPASPSQTPPPRRIFRLLGLSSAGLLVLLIGIGIGFYLTGQGWRPGAGDAPSLVRTGPNVDAPATEEGVGTPPSNTPVTATADNASSTEADPESESASELASASGPDFASAPGLAPEPDEEPARVEPDHQQPDTGDSAERPETTADAKPPPMSGTAEIKPQSEPQH